jgi:hypothetical protein
VKARASARVSAHERCPSPQPQYRFTLAVTRILKPSRAIRAANQSKAVCSPLDCLESLFDPVDFVLHPEFASDSILAGTRASWEVRTSMSYPSGEDEAVGRSTPSPSSARVIFSSLAQ